MFNTLMNKRAALTAKFSDVKENDIQDVELRSKFRKLKAKQGGFTLLELLVVVAILAAIAGTASLALQDTDARASAAAHVAMMDELNKGIRSYRVLNKNELPNNFDSLIQTSASDGSSDAALLAVAAIEDVGLYTLTATDGIAEGLAGGGITSLQYVSTALDADGTASALTCAGTDAANPSPAEIIASRANAVVAGNVFLSPAANGCGYSNTLATGDSIALWTGGYERVLGSAGISFDATALELTGGAIDAAKAVHDAPLLMAVGLGPSSTLFNANTLGGMTTVPVYRHVSETEYNRFVALFHVADAVADDVAAPTAYTAAAAEQVVLTAIVDGAGDTKEEELGEWDGTRNTI